LSRLSSALVIPTPVSVLPKKNEEEKEDQERALIKKGEREQGLEMKIFHKEKMIFLLNLDKNMT